MLKKSIVCGNSIASLFGALLYTHLCRLKKQTYEDCRVKDVLAWLTENLACFLRLLSKVYFFLDLLELDTSFLSPTENMLGSWMGRLPGVMVKICENYSCEFFTFQSMMFGCFAIGDWHSSLFGARA